MEHKSRSDQFKLVVQAFAPQILSLATGAGLPISSDHELEIRPLNRRGIHPVGLVEVKSESVTRRLFGKANIPHYTGSQDLEKEAAFLTEIGPSITADNPALRTPGVFAYFPTGTLLLMEAVDGHSLKEHLFDFTFRPRRDLSRLIELSGEWLGRLHGRTRQPGEINPLAWLIVEFEDARTREMFERVRQLDSYNELLLLLRLLRDVLPDFRRSLCTIHAEFTPLHVLVSQDQIYVIDFASSRIGLPHEDLGFFTSFNDNLLPWRRAVGALRVGRGEQQRLFLDSYFAHAPFRPTHTDHLILSCIRLRSLVRLLAGWQGVRGGVFRRTYSSVGRLWLERRLQMASRQDLPALREAAGRIARGRVLDDGGKPEPSVDCDMSEPAA